MTTSSPVIPLWRFLYTHNPFYLIGTLLILFGLQQCVGSEPRVGTSGLLTGLLAGYTLLLAGIAVLVIRFGQLWDDARTILLVIVLLFFVLSASLDVQLADAPLPGTLLVIAALAFAVFVSEGLLRGLRIGLAPQYRAPYYLILALLFLYPAVPAWLTQLRLFEHRPWAIFAFPALLGLALLTLIPAARTRRRREPCSNTPWLWPYYPWSLFVFLTVGGGIRAWWLTISFELVEGSQTYFQLYFLLPLCLAWSALILEMGRARRSHAAVAAGMLLPLAGLAASFSGSAHSPVEAAFLDRLVATIGSPPQIAVLGLLVFYGWAWLRNVRAAEGFLMASGLLAAVLGPDTFTLDSLCPPKPLPLVAVAAALLIRAAQTQSTWRAIAGLAMVVLGARYLGVHLSGESALRFWQWHAPLLGLMALSAILDDPLAKAVRELSWRGVPCLAWLAALAYPWFMPVATLTVIVSYLVLLLLVSMSLWRRQKALGPLVSVLATLGANLSVLLQFAYVMLERSVLVHGLPWLAVGLLVITLALFISMHKMGLWRQTRYGLEWLNLALIGERSASHPGK